MKLTTALFTAAVFTVAASRIHAQTLNWGNEVFGDLTDSEGVALNNTFVFELGSFREGFVPTESNLGQWVLNWEVFDRAAHQESFGYFTSTVYVNNNVTTSNTTASTMSFAGLEAYLWIRNQDDPVEGAEWLLTRALNWTFPTVGGDCCNTRVIEWAVSDLDSGIVPVWGGQNGVLGSGEFGTAGTRGLQTFTFVPEPSSALLVAMTGGFLVLRRRRTYL
ncbi:MAG: PEP-CTERM sorting domain-containing protein [Luteolibacter sp.]